MPQFTEYHEANLSGVSDPQEGMTPTGGISLKKIKDPCKPCVLSCLERPKYFCGQLLTEEDLQAEQRYQKEKNRLHNRYLHGWGVVCGLKVTCHPKCASKGNILIEKGYAIDCCGNDIIVCEDEELDFIRKIKECQPEVQEDECLSEASPEKDECEDMEKKYCLIIKYKEEEARPVTALKRDEEGCSVRRCEPSRIREGYAIEVKECKDCGTSEDLPTARAVKSMKGTFPEKMVKCFSALYQKDHPLRDDLLVAFKVYFSPQNINPENHNAYLTAFCEIKKYIQDTAKTASVRCDIKDQLCEIVFPPILRTTARPTPVTTATPAVAAATPEDYKKDVHKAFYELLLILIQGILDCVCLQLLYPCPECREDDQVVLACVTVRGDKITHICNLSRKQVMSFPKLFYWLPVNVLAGSLINYLCCELQISDLVESIPQLRTIPETIKMAEYVTSMSMKKMSANLGTVFKTPGVINAGLVNDKNINEAKNILLESDITVEQEIEFEPSLRMLSPENILSSFAIRPGTKVDLYVKDGRVILAKPHKITEKIDEETIKRLSGEIAALKTDIDSMKSSMISMRRDLVGTIEHKVPMEKPLLRTTTEIVRALTKEMQPEVLKDIDKVKGDELRKAGMKSVNDLFEAPSGVVSDAMKERVAIATRLIDHAENKTLEVAKEVSAELMRSKIKDLKHADKIDAKILAKKIGMRMKDVEKVLRDISKSG